MIMIIQGNEHENIWIDAAETIGASVQVTLGYEIFITKYTRKDIEKLNIEKELNT